MSTVTLLQKAYGDFRSQSVESLLKLLCKGLDVQVKVRGATAQGWIQVDVDGEDEKIALLLLEKEFGLAPVSTERVEKFAIFHGRIVRYASEKADELLVDIGVFQPEIIYARIPLDTLKAELADGLELPLERLTQLYSLVHNVPLYVKILDVGRNGNFEAELSERQLALYDDWLNSMLDRLLVLGVSLSDVKRAVEVSRHFRDVVKVESLGLLEHMIVCKLGTDAIGLIPAIGRILKGTVLSSFSPRKIEQTIARSSL